MNLVKGTTRVCGLIGNPVGHSISPLIHNALADMLGINLVYAAFQVDADDISAAVKGAKALNILGMNVTVPHKSAVINELKSIDPLAEQIGAVNTLVCDGDGYRGYNTDILGLKRELKEENISLENAEVIILGAGGVSKAIAFLCASENASKIYLLNRTIAKAEAIADSVNSYYNDKVTAMLLDDYRSIPGYGSDEKKYIVIQASSVGLHPKDDEVIINDAAFYRMTKAGIDVIYNPYETMFMKLVKEAGSPAYNGLKMLLYQGVEAFELWNNVQIDKKISDKVYDLMKKELGINE